MKKIGLCISLALAALCITGCDCPECGLVSASANVNTIFVTRSMDGTFQLGPDKLIITSSCDWTATNLRPEYLDFANTNGVGGASYLPVGLTPEFLAAFAADINNFPVDATGNRKIGSIHVETSCAGSFDVHVYLKDILILSFDLNGGTGINPPDVAFVAGEPLIMPAGTGMTYSSKTFVGWNTDPDGKGIFCKDGTTKTFTATTALYAMWSGDGQNPDEPTYIYNRRTLMEVQDYLDLGENRYYLVVADFNANYDEENNISHTSWIPVGTLDHPLVSPLFKGNNHHIEYHINSLTGVVPYDGSAFDSYSVGLFGFVGDGSGTGEIKDLRVSGSVNVEAVGDDIGAGGVAGSLFGITLTGCTSAVTLSCPGNTFYNTYGGVVGYNSGTIQYCTFTGSINSKADISHVGGISGDNQSDGGIYAVVQYCVSIGSLSARATNGGSACGGITGVNFAEGTVQYCTTSSSVKSETTPPAGSSAGGIVGMGFGPIIYNVALNRAEGATAPVWAVVAHSTPTQSGASRIIGNNGGGGPYPRVKNDNYGLQYMWVEHGPDKVSIDIDEIEGNQGANVSLSNSKTQDWWTGTAGWSTTNWNFETLSTLGLPWPIGVPIPQP